MSEATITINFGEETLEVLRDIADALASSSSSKPKRARRTKAEMEAARAADAAEVTAPKTEAAPASPPPAPPPPPPPPPPPAAAAPSDDLDIFGDETPPAAPPPEKVDKAQLLEILKKFSATFNSAKARELLAKYDATTFPSLSEDHYAAVYAEAKAALES